LEKVTSLLGIDPCLLAIETRQNPIPFGQRVEEQTRPETTRSDKRLAGLAVPKSCWEADATFLID
jgi:hypothetical protein